MVVVVVVVVVVVIFSSSKMFETTHGCEKTRWFQVEGKNTCFFLLETRVSENLNVEMKMRRFC